MFELQLENVLVKSNVEISEEEANAYVLWAQKKYAGKAVNEVVLNFDGEEVGVETHLAPESFEKIRRITGYLVGTVDRFNDGKRAEERDRVKHM
ncbi:MAG: anaerobic ribonucleoside-triphosphate reductase [Traorella sp.]